MAPRKKSAAKAAKPRARKPRASKVEATEADAPTLEALCIRARDLAVALRIPADRLLGNDGSDDVQFDQVNGMLRILDAALDEMHIQFKRIRAAIG